MLFAIILFIANNCLFVAVCVSENNSAEIKAEKNNKFCYIIDNLKKVC